MGTSDDAPAPLNSAGQPNTTGDERSGDHENQATAKAAEAKGEHLTVYDDQVATATDPAIAGNMAAENDLVAAVVSMPSETLSDIGNTLDQLVSSADLFDVPALDFDGTT